MDISLLQDTVGNQAVGRILGAIQPGNIVQRYEGPEHQDMGDRNLEELHTHLQSEEGQAWARQYGLDPTELTEQIGQDSMRQGGKIRLRPGVELTPGEIISLMGDFYGSWQNLRDAPVSELVGNPDQAGAADSQPGILDVMHQERNGLISGSDAGVQYEEITGGRYLALAERNDAHFARRNRLEWQMLHEEAIGRAKEAAAQNSDSLLQEALLIDASGGHFLTDAFAAGHMFDKDQVVAQIGVHLASNSVQADNPEMQGYIGIIDASGKMGQLVLKNIHDRMNREGVEIANDQGMRWRTYGDDHLRNAEETRHIASLAVFLSRRQIEMAHRGEAVQIQDVLNLMPNDDSVNRATEIALSYIPEAAQQVPDLVYRNRGMAQTQFGPVLGAIIESNLSTVGHPGRQREIDELLQSNERIGNRSVVIPNFTIAEWD